MTGPFQYLALTWHEPISKQNRLAGPAAMTPIELSCDYDSLNSVIQRIAMFSPKETDQAFFWGSFLPLGSQNQPVVSLMMSKVPLSGITLKWLRGAMRFLFIHEPGADNGAINDWKLITSHFCRAQCDASQFNQEQKVNGCSFTFTPAVMARLASIIALFGRLSFCFALYSKGVFQMDKTKYFNISSGKNWIQHWWC